MKINQSIIHPTILTTTTMKHTLPISATSLIRTSVILVMFIAGSFLAPNSVNAQIWEPEGLNMPGGWNGWTNPPTNNLALASYSQVPGGRVIRISTGIARWQTVFSVATTGGDIVGGTYNWLFTSGPAGSPWNNKWASVNVIINTLQQYTKEGAADNSITVTDGKWYTMNWEDAGYNNTRAIFMETSTQPVNISTVTVPSLVDPGNPATITVTVEQTQSVEELFFIRYSADAWVTSNMVPVAMTGLIGTAVIPGQLAGTVVSYYAFSSVLPTITADFDLYTIKLNSNGGTNYTYTVTSPIPVITFANLQTPPTGTIDAGDAFQVYGRAGIPGITGQVTPAAGLLAWVGYSAVASDPSTWNTWMPATYTAPFTGYDEFVANIGPTISVAGTYYYATRFSLNGGAFLYGGYSLTGGGFWDGTSNVSGVLTVQVPSVPIFRTLENITVNSEESLCYDAKSTITVAGNNTEFKVLSGGSVNLISGGNIIFLPGTTVFDGGYLHGSITSAGLFCNAPVLKEAGISSLDPADAGDYQFRIFPNPATTEVNVSLSGISEKQQSELSLFGIRGNRIFTRTLTSSENISFSVAGLPPGIYTLRLISGDKVQTRKLVRQ
jgi:hypothetical protein